MIAGSVDGVGMISNNFMYLGGLKPLQTASLIVAVPLIFVIMLCVWSFLRWLREDLADNDIQGN